eukprot:1686980-Amphidinium_carterae.1
MPQTWEMYLESKIRKANRITREELHNKLPVCDELSRMLYCSLIHILLLLSNFPHGEEATEAADPISVQVDVP